MESNCKFCGKLIKRRGTKIPVFCSIRCKGEWQKTQKPVDKAWLYQKYVVEQLGTYEIAKLVNRNPKNVYNWIIGYNIPTRTKKEAVVLFNKREETKKKRSSSSKGRPFPERAKLKLSLERKGKPNPKITGKKNGMYGRRGELSPSWKGGVTPERQSFYETEEWKQVRKRVYEKYEYKCDKCECNHSTKNPLHIHHIISFAIRHLRCDMNNLILLCKKCHLWAHSKKNVNKDYIEEFNE